VQIGITLTPPVNTQEKIVRLHRSQRWKAHKNPYHQFHYFEAKAGKSNVSPKNDEVALSDVYPSEIHEEIYAYDAAMDVEGVITLSIPPGKKAEHLGMRVEFVGRIDMDSMAFEGRPHYDFISLSKELEPPATIYDHLRTYPFRFGNIEKAYETYHGKHVSVRYFVRVALERKFLPPIVKEHEIVVQSCQPEMGMILSEPIKMEVGIEDCLHIEFEYVKRHFHLEDVIYGKVHFLLVRIKIKHMELAVIRRETAGNVAASEINEGGGPASGGTALTETQVLCKHEVMNGAPVKGEIVPVRLYIAGIPGDVTPTYSSGSRFSVRYFLNLVLVDEEDRRYFKQQEIILWRRRLG